MDLISPKISQMLTRILLIIIIACSGAVIYAVNEIDKIINVQLYGFDLKFDNAWADPYHSFTWIIYGALGAAMLVSVVILGLGFMKTKQESEPSFKPQKNEPLFQTTPASAYTQPKQQEETKPTTTRQKSSAATEEKKAKSSNKQNNNTSTSSSVNGVCPGCKKTYTQSLVMLDFEDGKSKLVNVCPYCNHVLGDNEKSE